MTRKARRSVTLDDIMTSSFLTNEQSLIDPTLRGHLALEALLVELIQLKNPGERAWKFSFPDKTEFLYNQGLIGGDLKSALDTFNNFRNDFAHIFGYAVTFSDIHSLARKLEADGVDFSDSVGHLPEAVALEWYGDEQILLAEILWCLLYEIACALEEAGGRNLL